MAMSSSQKKYPQNLEEFNALVAEIKNSGSYKDPLLFAIGKHVRTNNGKGELASVRYPFVNGPGMNTGTAAIIMKVLEIEPTGVKNVPLSLNTVCEILSYFKIFENDGKEHKNIKVLNRAHCLNVPNEDSSQGIIASFIFEDIEPQGVEDSTLKLYGLSNRFFKPNELNFSEVFKKFPNVAWIGDNPLDAAEVNQLLLSAAFDNLPFAPHMVDKFPLYIHRINALEMGVRITDQHKVRLGAYLGEGTTIMPGASYVNFNAGTEGKAMVEGRISSGVFVGEGTDIGGGAGILGILSGGNDVPISIGRNCLLEVNCVLGIPIGDAVIIGSGTSVVASSRVLVKIKGHPLDGKEVKAAELAGIDAVTFRTNNINGVLEVVQTPRNIEFAEKLLKSQSILNADLHKNS